MLDLGRLKQADRERIYESCTDQGAVSEHALLLNTNDFSPPLDDTAVFHNLVFSFARHHDALDGQRHTVSERMPCQV